jgi:hypothetical protein
MFAAPGVALGAAPETPRKRGHGSAIDDLVRRLRNEMNVAIAQRDSTYLPSQHKNSTGDALYDRIKTLYWNPESREALYATIEECRSEFLGSKIGLSPQQRTDFVFKELHDTWWFAKNSVRPSPFRANTPSGSKRVQGTLQRVDSGAHTETLSTPASPLAAKSMTSASIRESSQGSFLSNDTVSTITLGTSVATTQSTDDDDHGSSWDSSQFEDLHVGLYHTASIPALPRSIPHTTAIRPGRASTRRTRSDEQQDVLGTPIKKARQELRSGTVTPQNEHKIKDRHHQITALAANGKILEYPYKHDGSKSFAVSVERARMAHHGISSEQATLVTDNDHARALIKSCGTTSFQQSHPVIWDLPKATCTSTEDAKLVLSGSVSLNAKNDKGQLFQVNVHPIRKETDSTHIERHFGWDRFLTLAFPCFTQDLPGHLQGQGEAITSAFGDWILEPKHFMGRVWRFFYTKEIVKKVSKKRVVDNSRVREFSFFAISGDGIETRVSYFDFIDWMLPIKQNASQSVYKLFARIALYISRTKPTVQFRYDQIRFVEDIVANGEQEDMAYEDPAFDGKCRKNFDMAEVMTDGCARISVGVAMLVCKTLGIAERPSAFQARINGHKGVWFVSDSYETHDAEHLEVWIELRPSQAKVKIRDQDRHLSSCESDRWSFNVVDYTRPPRCSELHRDFLQVLENRHVPRSTLLEMIEECFELDRKRWSDAMEDPARWAILRDEHFRSNSKRRTLGVGLPHAATDKTELLMDEAGYLPRECATLSEAQLLMQELHFQRSRSNLSFMCPKSTFLIGIPDATKLLPPGTVHLSLSRPLVDKTTGEVCDSFAGRDVLITRHPTLRNSDMQKVRCIFLPELAYLKDVVVMSTRGQIPLASKLQGGDYDGDKFWICVDDRLVQPFMNAPVLEQAGLDDLGIKQEKQTLNDVVDYRQLNTDECIITWLRTVLPFACQEKQLGAVTNYLYELIYHCGLSNAGVGLVADLHDLIIDADKNGYVFEKGDFGIFRRKNRNICLDTSKLPKPAFRESIESVKFEYGSELNKRKGLRDFIRPIKKHKQRNILDVVVFDVLNPRMYEHLDNIQQNFVKPAQDLLCDEDLQYVLRTVFPKRKDLEISTLTTRLNEVYDRWTLMWTLSNRRTETKADSENVKALQDCMDHYNSIRPVSDDDYWTMRPGPNAPDTWECFKVGVLASRDHYIKKRRFMLWVATDTVRYLKAMSTSGQKTIDRIKAVKKPKVPKNWAELDAAYEFATPTEDDNVDLLDFDEETL